MASCSRKKRRPNGHENYVDDLKKIGIAARDLLTKIDSLPLDGADGNGAKAKKPEGEVASAPRVQSGEYVAPAGSDEQEEPDKPARVLVVDDVELNRSMLSRRLGKRGYDVEVAEGGAEALEMIGEKDFDIVLLDIMMPEVQRLRRSRRSPQRKEPTRASHHHGDRQRTKERMSSAHSSSEPTTTSPSPLTSPWPSLVSRPSCRENARWSNPNA